MRPRIGMLFHVIISAIWICGGPSFAETLPRNYVFIVENRDQIADPWFRDSDVFEGAQLRYSWRELEPEKGTYALALIERDLDTLARAGKKLWIQLQDTTFHPKRNPAPQYLIEATEYGGGSNMQYSFGDDDDSGPVEEGWVVRRWDPIVQARLHAVYESLGAAFDGRIAGINLAETSVGFGQSGRYYPAGFTPERYRDATIENMLALKQAFAESDTIIYANFMPGEWRPWDDRGYLKAVYDAAKEHGVGVGGPDIKVHKRAQMNHSYGLIRECAGSCRAAWPYNGGISTSPILKRGNRSP